MEHEGLLMLNKKKNKLLSLKLIVGKEKGVNLLFNSESGC